MVLAVGTFTKRQTECKQLFWLNEEADRSLVTQTLVDDGTSKAGVSVGHTSCAVGNLKDHYAAAANSLKVSPCAPTKKGGRKLAANRKL
eukprot:6466753-Amphidinium_carterae.1